MRRSTILLAAVAAFALAQSAAGQFKTPKPIEDLPGSSSEEEAEERGETIEEPAEPAQGSETKAPAPVAVDKPPATEAPAPEKPGAAAAPASPGAFEPPPKPAAPPIDPPKLSEVDVQRAWRDRAGALKELNLRAAREHEQQMQELTRAFEESMKEQHRVLQESASAAARSAASPLTSSSKCAIGF